ncbi:MULTISPECIES: cell division protein SepF [unclassified Oceanobacillus]|uniref:cell division protein SepF n=1 Tax=unclassified Oceanobacillus TaxID=2630292 RepID=UPI001BE7B5B6|nr:MULTISPECIES: cell division protein SepF [unclassified Oceanobacillus]MBT2598787.1 cell division protein SepF [Oceanobacillus sp. ISL-74]MBT2651706.1 cell division protein SepF [Oceanobacillus sp. ISL-73]
MSFKNKLKDYFMGEEYEYEYADDDDKTQEPKQKDSKASTKNVVNLSSVQHSNSRVVLIEPRNYNEAQEIADNIVNRRAVIINLQRVDHQQAKRIVDFLSGTVYAVNGDIQKLGAETFLCTPDNVEVSGTISEMLYEQEEYDKGW